MMETDWSPAQSKSVERRQSVQWKAKAEELQDRVDFLEAALEAKSQSYEEDMAALEERLAEMRTLLTELQWVYPEDGSAYCPMCGQWPEQGHWENCRLARLLSAAPAGQVVSRVQGLSEHGFLYGDESLPVTHFIAPGGQIAIAHDHECRDGIALIATIREAVTEQGGE